MEYSSSNSSSTRPVASITTKGHPTIADLHTKGIRPEDVDGSVTVRLSPARIDALIQAIEIATPVIKASAVAYELKQLQHLLAKTAEAEREVKNKVLQDLRDPNLAWLAAIKRGPGN